MSKPFYLHEARISGGPLDGKSLGELGIVSPMPALPFTESWWNRVMILDRELTKKLKENSLSDFIVEPIAVQANVSNDTISEIQTQL